MISLSMTGWMRVNSSWIWRWLWMLARASSIWAQSLRMVPMVVSRFSGLRI